VTQPGRPDFGLGRRGPVCTLVQRLHDAAMRPLAVAAPPDGQQIALQHPQFLQSFANVAQVLVQGDLGA